MGLNCRICNSISRYLFKWTPPFSLYYCPSCKTLFSDPIPSKRELIDFYQGFLFKKPDDLQLKRVVEQKKLQIKQQFGEYVKTAHSFLDYGGGTGVASFAAVELGLEVTLYEVDKKAIDYVKSLNKCYPVHTCRNLSELKDQSFDLIYVDHVIEHVREPKELMSFLYDRLNQHGLLIFRTPNARNMELLFHPLVSVNSYLRRVYKFNNLATAISAAFFRPWTLDPPRHLYSFSAKSLKVLAQQIGVDKSETGYYKISLWEFSITKKLFRIWRNKNNGIKRFFLLTLSLFEIWIKLIELLFQKTNIISANGLYIRIKRD